MTFDPLWEQEELRGLQHRLRNEYPVWQRQRRQRRTVLASVASMAVLAGVALSAFHLPQSTRNYDEVCCNRSGIADSHWAEVAGHVLTVRNNQL